MGRREPRVGWGRYCCIFSRKGLHELKAHTLISVQLALPPGRAVNLGNIARATKKKHILLVWPEPQRGRTWGDVKKTGASPNSFQDAADIYEAGPGGKETQNHLLPATLRALSQECRPELSSHMSRIHEEGALQSQMPPGRAGTPNRGHGAAPRPSG